jgi:hypothetical protein
VCGSKGAGRTDDDEYDIHDVGDAKSAFSRGCSKRGVDPYGRPPPSPRDAHGTCTRVAWSLGIRD